MEKPDGLQVLTREGKVAFGNVIIGGKGRSIDLTIRNAGNRNLTGLSVVGNRGVPSDFFIKNLSKTTIKPGKTAILRIIFRPRDKGLRASTLRISSSDGDESPFVIKLAGRGLNIVN